MELDEIIEYAVSKGYVAEDIVFTADAFTPDFLEMLHHDRDILKNSMQIGIKRMKILNSISSKKT